MFKTEESMMDPVASFAATRWGPESGTWVVLREPQTETSIPDIVVARVDVDALQQRSNNGHLRPLNRSELLVLRALARTRPATLAKVAHDSHLAKDSAARVLRKLSREDRVTHTRSGSWTRTSTMPQIVTHAVSVEVKRCDWRRALFQARSYRSFANEAYVVFDAAFEQRFLRHCDLYRQYGVGLMSIDALALEVVDLLAASKRRPRDPLAASLFGEKALGALLGLESRSTPQTRLPSASALSEHQGVVQQIGALLGGLRPRLVACAGL